MSERDDIWLSRGFSLTSILSTFIGALMVWMLLGEPDLVIMLFGAVGGVMVGAVTSGAPASSSWPLRSARAGSNTVLNAAE